LFCLEIKRYIYADVDDLSAYEFDLTAIESLCLPADMLSVLNRVFETPVERVFGDLIRGKHGGVVVLASGKPGVGKTLTAEIYAETTQRPLYVLEMGELGTNAEQVEERLRNVFARVTRWNAVLQFDECEVFLSKRSEDLERSAIVGIFLRLLDYYEGMLFLTSNRPEVIDEAVLSRVMLRLAYPDLTSQARAEIWRNMFRAARLELVDGSFDSLAAWELNGRQIRNLTRLARILNPTGQITITAMEEVRAFGGGPSDRCQA
jgi:SpoVK/Ycf46/Vps4 family AAA+-type ATPase